MSDDIVFCAKNGRPILEPSNAAGSNVIPFPRQRVAGPKPEAPESYAETVTIPCSATFKDIDDAMRHEIAALPGHVQENDDI